MELYSHTPSPRPRKPQRPRGERLELGSAKMWISRTRKNLEPWYLAFNPLGMLPTLVDQGRAINRSSVICEYLEDVSQATFTSQTWANVPKCAGG